MFKGISGGVGWGIQTEKPSVGEVWIFSGTPQYNFLGPAVQLP